MSTHTEVRNKLFGLYEQYVGEPESAREVYGYWLFIAGYLVGFGGILFYLLGPGMMAGEQFFLQEIAWSIAAVGLSLGLFGIVLLLPVRRRAIQASVVGLAIAIVGVILFTTVYPQYWGPDGISDRSPMVIVTYLTGNAILAGVTALVPVVTGRKGFLVEEEGYGDQPPVMVGEAMRGALFAVFRNATGDWTWRIIQQDALASSEATAATRPDAEATIDGVKTQIDEAGLLEITTAAFRLYENDEGEWRWVLMRDDGSVVAEGTDLYEDRDTTEESVSFVKEAGAGADILDIDGAAFNYTERDNRWTWELLDADRNDLATGVGDFPSHEDAERVAMRMAEEFGDARALAVESIGVELANEDGTWDWRFVDGDDELLATSTADFDTRRQAESAVEDVLPAVGDSSVTVAGTPTYELHETDEGWRWRLVDATESVVARSHEPTGDRAASERSADEVARNVEAADLVDIDGAEYEVYPDGEDWHWRLATEDRTVLADSTFDHMSEDAATESIERVREQAAEADLIEFENAAFQVYEADDGEWRWRLIDEDGAVMADSGAEHESRSEATEAMMTLKQKAPDAEMLEIDTAAFELFRNDDDLWGWRLIDEAGHMVAEGPKLHDTRGGARTYLSQLKDNLHADVRTMSDAIFQAYTDDGDWRWRFVLTDGRVVADGEAAHATRDDLKQTVERIRGVAAEADSYAIGQFVVQLVGEEDDWRWRLLDRDRDLVAESARAYETEQAVKDVVMAVQNDAADAPVFSIESAVIWLTREDSGWRWTLSDEDREVLAQGTRFFGTRGDLEDHVEDLRRLAPQAGRVDFGDASYELFREGDSWYWRLLDSSQQVVSTGAGAFDSREEARKTVESVRDLVSAASVIEIDDAAFELHMVEGGWIWRLVDEGGDALAESIEPHESRSEARTEMNLVKEHAPDGWVSFTE
ncbi:DUF1508 domain-containing protein [Haloarchaeobius amylolyticus]|uniref:DUF1508 domain-containing protein n=1 Tax=Haloarchaeobius amylolyticus TaxID=1198296 RepID=UPI00226D6A60|nr:DUF1508 domain-containing protein [Haloarchaeobius amylolyticus]